jgi:hypothetical protein
VVADEPGEEQGTRRPAAGGRRRRRGGPSRAVRPRAIKFLEVETRLRVGRSGDPGGEKDRSARRKWPARSFRSCFLGVGGGAMVVAVDALLRPAGVRVVPPGRLTALHSWILFLSRIGLS